MDEDEALGPDAELLLDEDDSLEADSEDDELDHWRTYVDDEDSEEADALLELDDSLEAETELELDHCRM